MIDLTNHFLITTPNFPGQSIYARSVIYITEHDKTTGAVGVIINRPIGKHIDKVLQSINVENPLAIDKFLYWGGPVSMDTGYVLHKMGKNIKNQAFEITNNKNTLSEIVENNKECDELFIAMGYCGWTQNQIEYEFKKDAWIVVPADKEILFNINPVDKYDAALRKLGVRHVNQLVYGDMTSQSVS